MITLLLYNSAGCFLVFRIVQSSIQQKMDLDKIHPPAQKCLTSITFKTSDQQKINWLRKGKEFAWNQKHYDVVRVVKTTDACTYLCIADEDEDRLSANLDHYNNDTPSNVTKQKSSEKSITLFYPLYFTSRSSQAFYLSFISFIPSTIGLNTYTLVYREVHHPPPSLI